MYPAASKVSGAPCVTRAETVQLAVRQVKPIHRHQRRIGSQGPDDRLGHRRLAGSGAPAMPSRRRPDPASRRVRATRSAGNMAGSALTTTTIPSTAAQQLNPLDVVAHCRRRGAPGSRRWRVCGRRAERRAPGISAVETFVGSGRWRTLEIHGGEDPSEPARHPERPLSEEGEHGRRQQDHHWARRGGPRRTDPLRTA